MINSSIKFLITSISIIMIIVSINSFKNIEEGFTISNEANHYELEILDEKGKFIKLDPSICQDDILVNALSFNKIIYDDYIRNNEIRFIDFKDSDYIISKNIVPTVNIRNENYYSLGAIQNVLNQNIKDHLSFHIFDTFKKTNEVQLKKELHTIRRDLSVEIRFHSIDFLTENEIQIISDYYKSIP